jgi:WD40 repeat protein/methionine-rich copper-binding protein CopC
LALALLIGSMALDSKSPASAAIPTPDRNGVTAVAYSSDESTVAVGAVDGAVFIYNVKTGRLLHTLEGHLGAPVTTVAFSSKGDLVATGGRDSTVQVWSTTNGKRVAVLHGQEQAVRSLAFSRDGGMLLVGGEDSRALLWEVSSGSLKQVFGGNSDFVTAVAISPDGKTLATATRDALITLRDLGTYKVKGILRGHSGEVTSLAFSPDSLSLASGSADESVKLWDMAEKAERRALKGHSGAVTSVSFNQDGSSLASGSEDGSVRLWDPSSGTESNRLAGSSSPVTGVAFSPDGTRLLEGRANGVASDREVATGKVTKSMNLPVSTTAETTDSGTSSTARSSTLAEQGGLQVEAVALEAAAQALSSGPGGPILVVTSSTDPFSEYYAEILRAEGLNAFATADVGTVTAAALAGFDVVLLAARSLSSAQVSAFTDWVTGGGNLIAMRPDPQLAGLLGLTSNNSTLAEGYLKVDTGSRPGNGIVGETIQFHGIADRYALNGARGVATLYSNATTATSSPAVSLTAVGTQGGQAAAFTFDLARSVVYTRQGNPAWEGQERDGVTPRRPDDLYYGAMSGDVQNDWIDLTKVAIPQADEQQRLLVNLILEMNQDRKPLPRFWYLPRGLKAAVVMTGDDHGNGGTSGRFDQFLAESPAGCSVADWECIRGTSYIYSSTPITNAQAATYVNQGFEIGTHITTDCQDWTPSSLASDFSTQLQQFTSKYTSLSAPVTNRTHCIAWSDWATHASVELANGIRLDTNYYYWPPSWIEDRAGFFTGSGVPMRFTDTSGAMIDVYQAATQLTDESGQSYPNTVDQLLDRALGAEGYYGVFTINAHTDSAEITESTTTVASAKARGVPVVTAKQMLDWVDGRNASSFQNLAWNAGQLTFSVSAGAGARNLDMLVPARSGQWVLKTVTRDGNAVTYATQPVKGADYAFVRATSGAYVATYEQDTTAPTVISTNPADGATGASQSAAVTATFSEALDPSTLTSSTFELRGPNDAVVPASVSFDAGTQTARLTPNASLAPGLLYRATLRGGSSDPTIRDAAGNALATSVSWSFTTATGPTCPCSIWPATATPTNQVDQDPNAVELGVKFRSDVDGFVSGIRFWKGAQNNGAHVGSLWTTSGQRLANATFSNETASGWQQVTFGTPVAITANTTYIASYHTTSGFYAGDNNFFTTGVDNPPLHALATGVSANGVYAYSATPTFPTNTWAASNYWVDVVLTTSTGPDTTPPTVSSTSPVDNATGVATNAQITAVFNESLDPATVTSTTATLTGPGGTSIAVGVSYDANNRSVVMQPSSLLSPTTTYTAQLEGGISGPRITDLAGNALAADKVWTFTTGAAGPCDTPANAIVSENCKPGNPASEWDINGVGDTSIQGFATDISVNQGDTVQFKIDTTAPSYRIDIYRLGYYGGQGARKVATIPATATTATNQPNCLSQSSTGLIDCGNWSQSAAWVVPATATSGVYIARPTRTDTGGASHIPFIVRSDASTADIVFQTSDTTWQAYNNYGGNSLYVGSPAGRAYKVSYNRPFSTRAVDGGQDWLFNTEYPMIRWLESNGYDLSYITGVDSDRRGEVINQHKTFLSVGHDEYWSGTQRANVEAARNAGVNLAFFSGNEVFWKTRWESSIDGSGTAHRTLVSYKETTAGAKIDPDPAWTGTWRDPRFSPPSDGGRPENGLTGTIFMVNDGATTSIRVPEPDGKMRFWRNTSVAGLAGGATATLPDGTLGYEWDSDLDNGSRPAGLVRLSSTTVTGAPVLQDYGNTYASGTATHNLTLYRQPGGGLVFGAGTVQWAWGLDATHDRAGTPVSADMQQATVNLLADMSAQPATLATGLTAATKSTDTIAPTAVITSPADGGRVDPGSSVTISGTATDAGGGRVGGIEVSTDNGATWHPASGRATWTYSWTAPASGSVTLQARAADDSANLQSTPASATITVGAAPPAIPTGLTATANATGISLDWADTANATGYNVYRSDAAAGTYTKLTGTPVTVSAYNDTSAPVGTSYYRVTALNGAGESAQSNPASATRTVPPAAPTGLAATATATGITLDWADQGGVTGYNVFRAAAAAGPFTKVNGLPIAASAWDDTLAPAGASYYRVTAIGAGGESQPSTQVSATMAKAILLANPSFEIDANANNRPDSWTNSARFLRTTAAVRSGSYGGTHSGNNASYTIGQTRTGLTAGTSYSLAGWVYIPPTTDSFTFSIQIQWRSTASSIISTQTVGTFTAATSGWVKVSGTYTAPAGTTRAVVNMVASSLRGPIHVDDLTLR